MPIRFVCPSCQQPLEIDDPLAGQSVQCPYCKRVVLAPSSSTWEAGAEIPVASPARSGFEPPPPPRGLRPPVPAHPSAAPGWALAMSICSAGFAIVGVVIWLRDLARVILDQLGPNATPEQISRLQQQMIQTGAVPTNSISTLAMVLGAVCGIVGFVLGIRAIIRQERRGLAIFSCVVSLFFVVCQGLMTLMFLSIPLVRQQHGS